MKEVKPNGGSSLRDAIDRAASKVDKLSVAVDELAATHYVRWRMAYGEASWHSGPDGKCTAANSLLCDMLEANENDLTGHNWKNFIHPQEQNRVFSEWARVVMEGAQFNVTTRYTTTHGDVLEVRLKANPIICNNKVVGWIGTAHKI
jgi:PAS domain S-box-containing protein